MGSKARTRWHGLVVCASALLLVAGCAGGTSVGRPTAENLDGRGEITGQLGMTWWGAASRHEKTNTVADAFEAAHPGVQVEREFTDWSSYWQRLNIQASGGALPCLVQMQGRTMADYTRTGQLLDLDPMVASGAIDVSAIPPAVLDSGRGEDGKLYMIPYGATYDALMINQTLAERAGLTLPHPGYDWEQWRAFLLAARDALPEGVAASDQGEGINYLEAYLQGHGVPVFANGGLGFSKELLTEYWTMWQDLASAGALLDPAVSAEQPTQAEQTYIAQGRLLADVMPGNSLAAAQNTMDGLGNGFRLTTLPLPSGPSGIGNTIITSGFSISSSCANVPTAAAFIDFWTNDDASARLYASDNGAVTNSRQLEQQIADPALSETKRHELELYRRIADGMPNTVRYPSGFVAFQDSLSRHYDGFAFGRTSVAQAVDAFFADMEIELR